LESILGLLKRLKLPSLTSLENQKIGNFAARWTTHSCLPKEYKKVQIGRGAITSLLQKTMFHAEVQTDKDKTFSSGRKGELCDSMATYANKLTYTGRLNKVKLTIMVSMTC
jgi:hypothetical protein